MSPQCWDNINSIGPDCSAIKSQNWEAAYFRQLPSFSLLMASLLPRCVPDEYASNVACGFQAWPLIRTQTNRQLLSARQVSLKLNKVHRGLACSAKPKCSNCLIEKWAVTAFCLCSAVLMIMNVACGTCVILDEAEITVTKPPWCYHSHIDCSDCVRALCIVRCQLLIKQTRDVHPLLLQYLSIVCDDGQILQ